MSCDYEREGFCTNLLVDAELCEFKTNYDECVDYKTDDICEGCGADFNLEDCCCEDNCEDCGNPESDCECCRECGYYDCECCGECGHYICECCEDCGCHNCECED